MTTGAKISRFRVFALFGFILVVLCAVVVWSCRRELSIAYERWAMNSAYDQLFGNPQPIGNGLAAHDVSGIDVDAVLARYTRHRQRLVELGYFCHLRESLPHLAGTADPSSHLQRSELVQRMWKRFPQHKHYYLSPDGTFEAWDVVENEADWKAFLAAERKRTVSLPDK
jgi:hypothetical protein